MSLAFFGSDGVYTVSTSTNVTSAMQNTVNPYVYGGTASYGGLLGGLGSINIGGLPQQQGVANQTSAATLHEFMEKVSKPAKKAALGILAKLQEEIDGWHGNILERCPA